MKGPETKTPDPVPTHSNKRGAGEHNLDAYQGGEGNEMIGDHLVLPAPLYERLTCLALLSGAGPGEDACETSRHNHEALAGLTASSSWSRATNPAPAWLAGVEGVHGRGAWAGPTSGGGVRYGRHNHKALVGLTATSSWSRATSLEGCSQGGVPGPGPPLSGLSNEF